MKSRLLASLLAMATTLFLLPGCKKFYNYPNPSQGNVCDLCKITKLLVTTPVDGKASTVQEYDVNYDAKGNVMNVVRLFEGSIPPNATDQHFRYNKSGLLTDYYLNYTGNTGVVIWHRYSYPDRYTIVDTQFNYVGDINDPQPPDTSFSMRFFTDKLDSKGRIIKNTEDLFVIGFSYDNFGNLVLPGLTYDDKINPYRTSNTWQLIYSNYSMNNPNPGEIISYNEFGLPTDIKNGYLFLISFPELRIEYDCRQAKALYK